MPYKARKKSKELRILEFLNIRMQLSSKDKQHYYNIKKGFEGEVLFDSMTEELQCDCYILNDLLLQHNNSTFQIDTLIITNPIYLFDVKNFEGDYRYGTEGFYKLHGPEVNNPLPQLSRCESLLRQLLHHLGFKIPINASIVFVNPEFTLYQAPTDQPLIFPTQIKQFLKQLDKKPAKLTEKHKWLADKLVSMHIEDSPYKQIPSYSYDNLHKGIPCAICDSFSIKVEGRRCCCVDCGHEESIESAVLRCVEELKLLFPNIKLTTNLVYDWCNMTGEKRRIRRILRKNFKIVGEHQWAYFE